MMWVSHMLVWVFGVVVGVAWVRLEQREVFRAFEKTLNSIQDKAKREAMARSTYRSH